MFDRICSFNVLVVASTVNFAISSRPVVNFTFIGQELDENAGEYE